MQLPYVRMSLVSHDIWNEDWQVYEIDKPHFPAVGLEPYNRSGKR